MWLVLCVWSHEIGCPIIVVCHLRLLVVRLAPFQGWLIEYDDDLGDPDKYLTANRENWWRHQDFGLLDLQLPHVHHYVHSGV